jgi:hypothetical protein
MIAITPGKLVRPTYHKHNHLLGIVLERLPRVPDTPEKFRVLMSDGRVDVWYSHQIGVYD